MTTQKSIEIIFSHIKALIGDLEDHEYAEELLVFNGSSVGKHIRHIIDFYNCLLQSRNDSKVDYNCRERNPVIEKNKIAALTTLQQIKERFGEVSDHEMIEVTTDFSSNDKEERPIVKSSMGRELMYAFDHAIHHLAILKMGIRAAFPHVNINKEIGVAPSTIKYHTTG